MRHRDPYAGLEGQIVAIAMFGAIGLLATALVGRPTLWGAVAGGALWVLLALTWFVVRDRKPGGERAAEREDEHG